MESPPCFSGLIRPPDVYKLGLESKSFYVLANQIEPNQDLLKLSKPGGISHMRTPPKLRGGRGNICDGGGRKPRPKFVTTVPELLNCSTVPQTQRTVQLFLKGETTTMATGPGEGV